MSLSDVLAAIRWWAVLTVLGLAALPLTMHLLRRLPDKGYAFSKMIGLLLVSYVFWLLGSLGLLGNNLGSIVLAVIVLLVLSGLALRHHQKKSAENPEQYPPLRKWLRDHWGYILAAELAFILVFAFWVAARAQNPMITATEKPMEFAFLNSVGRSQSFPPLDPWLSGFAISYYYFGYVMTSVITRLAVVPEFVGFNLAVAWLAAGAALGAFGLVYNLITAGREKLKRQAVVFGLIAAIALPVAGNMEVLLEVLHANGVGSAETWADLNVRDLNGQPGEAENPRYETSGWWWWRSSRVINEHHISGRVEEHLEPIAEFPAFSFILGDLHPHVLALPFAFLSLAVAFSWFLGPTLSLFKESFRDLPNRATGRDLPNRATGEQDDDLASDLVNRFTGGDGSTALTTGLASRAGELVRRLSGEEWVQLGFTALVLGGLSFLNTWDVLIHLFVILGAFVLGRWREDGRWDRRFWLQAAALAFILVIPAVLLYLPFYLGFRSQAGPPFLLPMTMRPTRLVHFLVIFGMPLAALTVFLGTLAVQTLRSGRNASGGRPWRTALISVTGLILLLFILMLLLGWVLASSPEGAGRIANIASELNLTLTPYPVGASFLTGLSWGTAAIARLFPAFLEARLDYPAMTLFLGLILVVVIGLLITRLQRTAEPDPVDEGEATRLPALQGSLPFVLLLIGTAVLLTLGPEFVYLKDVFSQRLNTIFKFYYQAWVLFGVTAVFALSYLWNRFRIPAAAATAVYGTALAVALLFPIYAAQSRSVEYRGAVTNETRLPPTLDGLAYLNRFNPDEYAALMWLRQNINGGAVILEAVGGSYSPFGHARVSANTGIPTVLGWPGHEHQWRGSTPEPGIREPAISTIYSQASWEETAALLDRFNVTHVYFGGLERSTYDPQAEEKFDQNLEVAYQNGSVKIYRWQPQ